MDKDLYIELLEKEIWRYCAGRESAKPLPDRDPDILRKEIQDLKLENDRLQKRNDYMYDFIYDLSKAGLKWTSVRADVIIKKLEEL